MQRGHCQSWLVPIGLSLGCLAFAAGVILIVADFKWGYALDGDRGTLTWWDTRFSDERSQIKLALLREILVRSETAAGVQIWFVFTNGHCLPFPSEALAPRAAVDWVAWAEHVAREFSLGSISVRVLPNGALPAEPSPMRRGRRFSS